MKATPDGQGGFNVTGAPSGGDLKATPDGQGGFNIAPVAVTAGGEVGIMLLIFILTAMTIIIPVGIILALLVTVMKKPTKTRKILISLIAGGLTIIFFMFFFVPGLNPFAIAPFVSLFTYLLLPS